MGVLPLAWLFALSLRGKDHEPQWWWLALAFAVSWAADETALQFPKPDRWWLTFIFPISQTTIVTRVLWSQRRTFIVLGVLVAAALLAVAWEGVRGPDVILYSVACLCIVGIVWLRPELSFRLRLCLLVYFGLGLIAWLAHAEWIHEHPHGTAPTWWPYQGARLAGLLLFCWAVMKPGPSLRMVR